MKSEESIHQEVDDHIQWYKSVVEERKMKICFDDWCNIKVDNNVLKKNLKHQLERAIEYNALFGSKIPSVNEVLLSWKINL